MNYRKKTLQDWNNLTEEQQTEVIMQIGAKLNKQEIWYWEGLVYSYRTLQDRIDRANNFIDQVLLYRIPNKTKEVYEDIETLQTILNGDDR